jgi:hypothetical protein
MTPPLGLEKRTSTAKAVEHADLYGTAKAVPFVRSRFPICLKALANPILCGSANAATCGHSKSHCFALRLNPL